MNIIESFKMAFSALLSHKMRSVLTMIGIIVGVSSVVAILAIGQVGERALTSQFSSEDNSVEIVYEPSEDEFQNNPDIIYSAKFSQEDISEIKTIPKIIGVQTSLTENGKLRSKSTDVNAQITAINMDYFQTRSIKYMYGREFTSSEFLGTKPVVIMSSELSKELFNQSKVIGEFIHINQIPFEIIGVFEGSTSLLEYNSNRVYIPENVWSSLTGDDRVSELIIQTGSSNDLETASNETLNYLNQKYDTNSYNAFNMEIVIESINAVSRIMTLIIASVAGVSLLVGGIGVMNIMLVSVTERTKEIGIRKALGATQKQIMLQFLIESVTLTSLGGLIGIIIGYCVILLLALATGLTATLSPLVIVSAVLFSMIIGIIFGMVPAKNAAKMDPIESLRYE